MLYELVGKDETIQKLLRIKIVDDEEPILTLSDHNVYLEEDETFDCRAYILEAYDEINGDLRNRVECDSTLMEDVSKQEVLYRVKDSAGNVVEDSLTVEIITSPKNTWKMRNKMSTIIDMKKLLLYIVLSILIGLTVLIARKVLK